MKENNREIPGFCNGQGNGKQGKQKQLNVSGRGRNQLETALWIAWRRQIFNMIKESVEPKVLDGFIEILNDLDYNQMVKMHRFIQAIGPEAFSLAGVLCERRMSEACTQGVDNESALNDIESSGFWVPGNCGVPEDAADNIDDADIELEDIESELEDCRLPSAATMMKQYTEMRASETVRSRLADSAAGTRSNKTLRVRAVGKQCKGQSSSDKQSGSKGTSVPYMFRNTEAASIVTGLITRAGHQRSTLVMNDGTELCFANAKGNLEISFDSGRFNLVYVGSSRAIALARYLEPELQCVSILGLLCSAGEATYKYIPSFVTKDLESIRRVFPDLKLQNLGKIRPEVESLWYRCENPHYTFTVVDNVDKENVVVLGELVISTDGVAFRDFGAGLTWVQKLPSTLGKLTLPLGLDHCRAVDPAVTTFTGLTFCECFETLWRLAVAYVLGCAGVVASKGLNYRRLIELDSGMTDMISGVTAADGIQVEIGNTEHLEIALKYSLNSLWNDFAL